MVSRSDSDFPKNRVPISQIGYLILELWLRSHVRTGAFCPPGPCVFRGFRPCPTVSHFLLRFRNAFAYSTFHHTYFPWLLLLYLFVSITSHGCMFRTADFLLQTFFCVISTLSLWSVFPLTTTSIHDDLFYPLSRCSLYVVTLLRFFGCLLTFA